MPHTNQSNRAGFTLLAATALVLTGCAGADLSTGSIAPYEPANSFYPYGYQDTLVAENQHRVSASGSPRASKARLEKIALTRAAEIGVEKKKKFFMVSNLQHGVACQKKLPPGHKRDGVPESARPTVTVDVVYADAAAGPEYRETATSLAESKAALAADTSVAKVSQVDELKGQCGV